MSSHFLLHLLVTIIKNILIYCKYHHFIINQTLRHSGQWHRISCIRTSSIAKEYIAMHCDKTNNILLSETSQLKMPVIKLKSNDDKVFEVDIEVTFRNLASNWNTGSKYFKYSNIQIYLNIQIFKHPNIQI